jgi:hypothetical protein
VWWDGRDDGFHFPKKRRQKSGKRDYSPFSFAGSSFSVPIAPEYFAMRKIALINFSFRRAEPQVPSASPISF